MDAHMDGRMRRRTLKQIAREAEAVAEEAEAAQMEHFVCTREASDTAAPAAWSSNGDASAKGRERYSSMRDAQLLPALSEECTLLHRVCCVRRGASQPSCTLSPLTNHLARRHG